MQKMLNISCRYCLNFVRLLVWSRSDLKPDYKLAVGAEPQRRLVVKNHQCVLKRSQAFSRNKNRPSA